MKTFVAIDIGASSGRHVLGYLENGQIVLKEMYRFENGAVSKDGHLYWDHTHLENEIVAGLKACKEAGFEPESVGIDTWGVDYAFIDENGSLIGDTFAYRDSRTQDYLDRLDIDALYSRTGIQRQPFNTVYQLMSDLELRPDVINRAARLLFMPEYLSYCLTGKAENEYTIASTSGLLNAQTRDWDRDLITSLGLPQKLFGTLRQPGYVLGAVKPEIAAVIGYTPTVIMPPMHDTASAVLGSPIRDGDAFLSSGTWSLLGAEITSPVLLPEARLYGLTNEGGVNGTIRLLKNIMGLWIIQNIRKELPEKLSFGEMADLARENDDYPVRFDVDAPEFLAPVNMTQAIRDHIAAAGETPPATIGQLLSCVNHSLAESYAKTIRSLEKLTGKSFKRLCIVGGGSQNNYLNELTAKAVGIPVTAGPTEGTAIGNLLCQMIASGVIRSVEEARALLPVSFDVRSIQV